MSDALPEPVAEQPVGAPLPGAAVAQVARPPDRGAKPPYAAYRPISLRPRSPGIRAPTVC